MTGRKLSDQMFAVGLIWLAPGSVSATSRKSRKNRELLSVKPAPIGYVELETPSGLQFGATHETDDIGVASAAARLAQSQSSAVLIEKISADEFWLCAVEDGTIFPAGDIVGSRDLIANRLEEIRTDIKGTDIRLYEKTGTFGLPDAEPREFSDLISTSDSVGDITCQVIIRRNIKKPILAVSICMLVTLAGYGAWTYYFQLTDESKTAKLEEMQRQANSLKIEKKQTRDYLSQNAPALLAEMADLVYNRPLRASGWRNHSYEWSSDVVTTQWKREHGNIAQILSHLEFTDYKLDENTGSVIERIEFPAPNLLDSQPIENLLGSTEDRYEFLDILAELPGKWSLGPAETVGKHFPIRQSRLTGSSPRLRNAISVAHAVIGRPIRIERITISLNNKYGWKIEGAFYGEKE